MQLRREQFSKIDQLLGVRYQKDLAAFYRTKFPQLVARLDGSALEARIRSAIAHSDALGVKTAAGRVAYVGLALSAGPRFETNETVIRFVTLEGGDPDANVEWLFRRLCAKFSKSLPHGPDTIAGAPVA